MDDPLLVRGRQGIGQGDGDLEDPLQGHAGRGDQLGEPLALDQLHGEEADTLGLLDRVDRDDVGMIQRGQGLGLPLEAVEPLRICGQLGRQHLQGHLAVEAQILGTINLAHTARTELFQDPVMANGLADRD